MDIFDGPYFRLNKKLLGVLGLWPYDAKRKIIRICVMTLMLLLSVPHVTAAIVDISNEDKVDRIMEDIFNLLFVAQLCVKYVTLVFAEDKLKSMYEDIASNWKIIIDGKEKRILSEYSKRGRVFTIFYTCLIASTFVGNFFMPLVPEILNAIDPLPEPRPHLYLLKGEFLVENMDDHFYKIFFWNAFSVFYVSIIFLGIDPMYMVTVEQSTALYAIITYRLSELRGHLLTDLQGARESSYEWIVHTIKLHQTVLSSTNKIRDSYSACFFCLTLLNMVHLPLTCVVMIVYWHDRIVVVRYIFILLCLLIHVFTLFWPGQKLIDHSARPIEDACCNDWYETPEKTKKLLRYFMLRCSEPYAMTAGGLVVMNFEVYLQIVKTAASYVTVLSSFR